MSQHLQEGRRIEGEREGVWVCGRVCVCVCAFCRYRTCELNDQWPDDDLNENSRRRNPPRPSFSPKRRNPDKGRCSYSAQVWIVLLMELRYHPEGMSSQSSQRLCFRSPLMDEPQKYPDRISVVCARRCSWNRATRI